MPSAPCAKKGLYSTDGSSRLFCVRTSSFRGLALAAQGLKVLVVMFDLRKDTLHILCVQGGRSKKRRREYRQAFS